MVWLVFTAMAALVLSAAFLTTAPAADGEAGQRALAVAKRLEGQRFIGTPALASAVDEVDRLLGNVPGLEVVRQQESGIVHLPTRDVVYSVTNVIARVRGKSPETVLVNAHVDTPLEGHGAADDAVNVGAMIEAARVLAAGDVPSRTIVFLFNGGEEVGFTGADAFTRHEWARDVRWYLNMEAVGSGGLPVLFQASPGSGDLVAAAGAVSRPRGSFVGQQLFQTGLLNSETDSDIWRGRGWKGLDYALVEDGYVYDTPLDRADRIPPGTAQSIVDVLVGVLSSRDALGDAPVPYFADVLSRAWWTADPVVPLVVSTAVLLAVAALVFREHRRGRSSARTVVVTASLTVAGLVTGLLAGLLAGGLGLLTGGSFAWYAHPWLIGLLHVPVVVAGSVVPLALWWRAQPVRRAAARTAATGVAAATAVLGCALAWAGVGAAYLLWTFSALLVLALWVSARTGRWWPLAVAMAPQMLLVAEFTRDLYTLVVPLLGREDPGIQPDLLLGALTAVIAFPAALVVALFALHAGRLRRVTVAVAVVAVAGLVAAAVLPPYTAHRPQHVLLMQEQDSAGARILLRSDGPNSPASLGLVRDAAGATGLPVREDALTTTPLALSAGTTTFERGDDGELAITVGATGAARVRFVLTGAVRSVNGRSFEGVQKATVDVVGHPEGFTAKVRADGPVTAVVEQAFTTTGPDAARVVDSLPDWVVVSARTTVIDRFEG
ncbi:M20/M25/M40 family metallo-hydrolase [Lentzea sp. NPDC060358]|uniref:M20/M25/M40 family metallo-hydrolase n=1 Tax=Lentzea sp. NPDC060358 TaxID=3347103 RepID=UPI0036494849